MSETNFGTTAPPPGSTDVLAYVSGEPDVNTLQQEYQYAWNQNPDVMDRIARSEDIRYARWSGQSWDGLKHQEVMPEGKRAMPYDRAPDTRVLLADSTILSLVDTDYTSFWNARVKAAPGSANRLTAAQSAELRQIISWMIHGPLRTMLVDQVEFASQVLRTVGWVVLRTGWRSQKRMRLQRVTMQGLFTLAAQVPDESIVAQFPTMVQDPLQEDAATELMRTMFPDLKEARARRVIKDLREDSAAEFPVPDEEINVPEVRVLVPWQDFILPVESLANPDRARLMFERVFLSEADVNIRAREEEWDPEFKKAVLKTKGTALENGQSSEHDLDENMQLCEVVYSHARQVDEDGVEGIYCTVFSPHVQAKNGEKGIYGNHWLLDEAHGQYSFIILSTEVTGKIPADARGVPDVLVTAQQEMKKQRDATYVFTELSVTPPLQKKGTQASRLPPELGPMGIINNVSGEWSWFPPPAGDPKIAFKLIEDVRKESQDYFGIPRPDTAPQLWQVRQQRQATRWLAKWGEAFWQLAVLAYQHLRPDELENVLNRRPLLDARTVARHRLLFWFDVRSMDPAWVESLLQSLTQMLPADSAGVVDHGKLMQFALAYLDPTLAEEVTTDQAGASQQLFKGVRDEIMSIMAGNEPMYVENDPTAKSKLMFKQQILGANPEYALQLDERSPQFNPRKAELMQKYHKNLQQSAVQQDNKIVGRLGVRPGEPQTNGRY